MDVTIARPRTIKSAIEAAMRALPPKARLTGERLTAKAWYSHQHKVIDVLEARLKQSMRLV